MSITTNFTPASVASADYPIAQTPTLGGEMQVYVSTGQARVLGDCLVTDNSGGVIWNYKLLPTNAVAQQPPSGQIVIAARGGGILQSSAATLTYLGLTGSFTPVAWSSNQGFNFPTGRAVELVGTYSEPVVSSASTVTIPTIGAGMLQGSMFSVIELPAFITFNLAGVTSDRKVTPPTRGSKAIPGGMEEGYWTTPGINKLGELEVTGPNLGFDDGLLRYAGIKCQAMLVTMRENRLLTVRAVAVDWTGAAETPYPSGESEATVTLKGPFNRLCAFPAP